MGNVIAQMYARIELSAKGGGTYDLIGIVRLTDTKISWTANRPLELAARAKGFADNASGEIDIALANVTDVNFISRRGIYEVNISVGGGHIRLYSIRGRELAKLIEAHLELGEGEGK